MHITLRLLLILTLLLPSLILPAQRLSAHRGTVPASYNFWFYVPAARPAVAPESPAPVPEASSSGSDTLALRSSSPHSSKPLVVFLHGASLCGRNLSRVRTYGTLDALARGLSLDAYVLAPQNPGGPWKPAKINALIDWSLRHHDIDSTRIYVLGMSLGGYGTIDYTAAYPDRVAAAMALCGGGTSRKLSNLCQVPLAIIHGTGDRAVSWRESQAVVNAMTAAGDTSRLIFKLLPKQNHGILSRYFYVPEVYDWLFEHTLADSARAVCRDYDLGMRITNTAIRHSVQPALMSVDDTAPVAEEPADGSSVHIVRRGDTLGGIAKHHHTTVAHLCSLNNITRTKTLRIGQRIRY